MFGNTDETGDSLQLVYSKVYESKTVLEQVEVSTDYNSKQAGAELCQSQVKLG